MLKGRIKSIKNTNRKFGELDKYLILKIEADYNKSTEEYILLTQHEFNVAIDRANKNQEDLHNKNVGIQTIVSNTNRKFGSLSEYHAINVIDEYKCFKSILLTAHTLERARKRAEKNQEDIELNKSSWFEDLLD